MVQSCALAEFIAMLVYFPKLSGFVTSTATEVAQASGAEAHTVSQSALLAGEKIFQPVGHELASVDLWTLIPLVTRTRAPAEYGPASSTLAVAHAAGLCAPHLCSKTIFLWRRAVTIAESS